MQIIMPKIKTMVTDNPPRVVPVIDRGSMLSKKVIISGMLNTSYSAPTC